MRLACDPFIGEHDFSSFCRQAVPDEAPSRRWCARCSTPAGTTSGDDLLRFEITANAFCHQMVRAIVGTLVEVGQGRKHAGDIAGDPPSPRPRVAGGLAPPHGLCLWEVGYPEPVPGWDLPSGPELRRGVLRVSREPCAVGKRAPRPLELYGFVAHGARASPLQGRSNKGRFVRTYSPKASEIQRAWHVIDADGLVLGRLCTEIARVLRGKHKPIFAPHLDTGDFVIVVNADKVVLTSGKADAKRCTATRGYPGGLKRRRTRTSSPASRPTPSASRCGACSRRARSAASS